MTQRQLKNKLEEYGVLSPGFEATQLICHFENCSSAEAMFGDYTSSELEKAVERRLKGEPLQYIIGKWEFMGLDFKVTPDTLIPRADTEILTQYLIDNLPKNGYFADLCTGSGCIALSALNYRTDAKAVAVEKYEKTLDIAIENAVSLNLKDRIQFILGDVCEDILDEKYDIIVSNPPYVTPEEMKELQREVTFEPRVALTDDIDGLSIIRKIIEIYPSHIKDGGKLAIEIGASQGDSVIEIAKKYNYNSYILKDLENHDRVVVIEI